VEGERPSLAPVGTRLTHPLQAFDQHRIGGQGPRGVHESAEQLIVARSGEAEFSSDGLFLLATVRPPAAFEFQDGSVSFGECGTGPGARIRFALHLSPLVLCRGRFGYVRTDILFGRGWENAQVTGVGHAGL
jgi:hypothetical protein